MNDDLDRRFASASTSLDAALGEALVGIDIPGRTPQRSSWPVMAAASLAVLLVGVGAVIATRTSDSVDVLRPADENSAPATTNSPAPTTDAEVNTESSAPPADTGGARRITQSAAGEITAPVASITQAFNTDGSLALLYRTGSGGGTHLVFETDGWSEVAALDLDAATDIEDIVWDRDDPDVLRYLDPELAALIEFDVSNGTASTLHTFDGCTSIELGDTSGSWGAGSDLVAAVCDTGDAELWISYDIASGRELARVNASTSDAPISLRSGAGFVSVTDDRLIVLDVGFAPTGVSFEVEVSAFTTALVDGADVLAATVFDGDEDTVGTVVAFDLSSGQRSVIIGPATGWQYPPTGTTISIAAGSLVAISTSPDLEGEAGDRLDSIVAVVDLATATVTNVTPHEMADGDEFANWSTPFVAISPDGDQLVFSSDEGTDRVNSILIRR